MMARFLGVIAVNMLTLAAHPVMGQAPGGSYQGSAALRNGVAPASYAAGAWAGGYAAPPSAPVIHERMLSQDRGWGYQDTHLDLSLLHI